MKHELIN